MSGMFAMCLDADGHVVNIGDTVVWSNPYGEDEDERFTVRGVVTEGGADGDLFLIDENGGEHYLGWCRKEK